MAQDVTISYNAPYAMGKRVKTSQVPGQTEGVKEPNYDKDFVASGKPSMGKKISLVQGAVPDSANKRNQGHGGVKGKSPSVPKIVNVGQKGYK